MSNNFGETPEQIRKNKKKQWFFIGAGVLVVGLVGVAGYFTLATVKQMEMDKIASQEQFAGDPEISSQLQAECQRSAERIAATADVRVAIDEYKRYADNCRSIYFVLENESPYRNEGMYPDLAIDIAHVAARSDRTLAFEMLSFARDLEPWEFYLGPVVCDSRAVVEAYLESMQLTEEKICFKKAEYGQQLMTELKNKNFSILPKTVNESSVVWVGLPDSEVGCPEKISVIVKLVRDLTAGSDVILEENRNEDLESNTIGFMYKSKTEDKVILEFEERDSCLQLSSVLVPSLQTQE